MCGRFVVNEGAVRLLGLFEGADATADDYNVAPTMPVRIVRQRHGEREFVPARWGMVAPRAPQFGTGKPVINARIETVASNGLFKGPFETSRCIVPASGYYEWQQRDDGKQPFFIHDPAKPLAMAGVVRAWFDPSKPEDDPEQWRLSMAIITRDAHVAPGEVHDRMPACLTPEDAATWLGDSLTTPELYDLLERSSSTVAHSLENYEVSRAVNSVKNNGPELIEPLSAIRTTSGEPTAHLVDSTEGRHQ
ncbi:putative SOS response-associated peptidase YedK [Glaciihabitans tibetensis]|uniref:Abasic site processing protein n=1 Tax=Glaciihabitans tibetensis TaxID=1266600 RepID=A0A2T0VK67_9MICO|nr:SOS response-associated peptidase [Glaciihabitans tibetensis]PRY70602.1 putative SOS response-associated peptidase YedK [Glaciihabitans tibetensis]